MSKKNEIDFYNIPIVDYLLSIGEPIEKQSGNYYQHKDHDSLKINAKKNYFIWNSRAGEENYTGGVIQYLQIMHSLSLHEALKRVEADLLGRDSSITLNGSSKSNNKALKPFKKPKSHYPKQFNYRVKEEHVPIEAQKYLVAERKIPNRIIRHFFSLDLISQNKNQEIVFKWYKGNKVVGFDKQGTVKLTQEQKDKYNYKKDYFKYIAPTTEENTMWGFNYLVGDPKNLFFFESSIDLLSYYAIHEEELLEKGNFWLIAINGVAVEKVLSFLQYGFKEMELEENLETLNVCLDNDKAGSEALRKLQTGTIKGIEFTDKRPTKYKDWNDELKSGASY